MKRADLIRLLAIGKGKLQMQEEDYREMLRRHGATLIERKGLQVYSASSMTYGQLESALSELKTKGFNLTKPKRGGDTDWRAKRIGVIRQLWSELHQAAVVRDATEAAMQAYCKRITKKDRLEFATSKDLNNCIEALKAMQQRNSKE